MIEPHRTENIVRERYAAGAKERADKLCCPAEYDDELLTAIPQEVIERDYGCGDPSRYLREGEVVVDLGSGTGKICFIAAQIVGPKGRIIGGDMTDEIFRVLKKGGRAVISDIVSDEEVPEEMQNDPELWSGCISGALTEERFLAAFENAGFYGIQILKRDAKPWRTVQGIEFRSVTIEAFKGKQGECFERNQAVIYKGPFKEVLDDDNHRMERGKRYAVCDKTYNLYKKHPYKEFFEFVDPIADVPLAEANPFNCARTVLRHAKETKGQDYNATTEPNIKCCDGGSCC